MDEKKKQGKGTNLESRALMACVEVGKLLTSTLDIKEILDRIMTKVSELIEAQNWSLLLRDEDSGELTFEIMVGVEKERIRDIRMACGEGVAGHVAESGEPLLLSNVREDSRFSRRVDALTGFTTESIFCVPLKTHGKVLGVIEVINVKDRELFESNYLPVLTLLADYAAIAIQNARFVSRIQRMSITDEYTGLYNARYLHQVLEDLIRDAGEQGKKLAVVFVDVDNFKQVVDSYGHFLGSRVLKEMGRTISSCLSDEDLLVKYGGDEYVIVLPGKSREEAKQLVEKILQTIRSSTYLDTESIPVKVTASFGIAVYPEDARSKKELLLLADKAMYSIKDSTKNGVGTS